MKKWIAVALFAYGIGYAGAEEIDSAVKNATASLNVRYVIGWQYSNNYWTRGTIERGAIGELGKLTLAMCVQYVLGKKLGIMFFSPYGHSLIRSTPIQLYRDWMDKSNKRYFALAVRIGISPCAAGEGAGPPAPSRRLERDLLVRRHPRVIYNEAEARLAQARAVPI
jgi:hypothetical protein